MKHNGRGRKVAQGWRQALAWLGVVALLLAVGQVALAQTVIIPDTVPGNPGGTDVTGTAQSLFSTITFWLITISGGVLVLVIIVIGLQLALKRDSRSRAEVYDWLLHVAVGAGLIFGASVIVRLLVGMYRSALG